MISPSHAAGFRWKIPSRSGEGKAAGVAIPISERFEIDLTPPSDSFAFCQCPLRCRVSLARVFVVYRGEDERRCHGREADGSNGQQPPPASVLLGSGGRLPFDCQVDRF